MTERVVLACVGAGRWGRNLVRVFDSLSVLEAAQRSLEGDGTPSQLSG